MTFNASTVNKQDTIEKTANRLLNNSPLKEEILSLTPEEPLPVTTVMERVIFLETAKSRDKREDREVKIEEATAETETKEDKDRVLNVITVRSSVICPGTAPRSRSQDNLKSVITVEGVDIFLEIVMLAKTNNFINIIILTNY